MLEILAASYEQVRLWIQTPADLDYSRSLVAGLSYLDPSVEALDRELANDNDLDYVGVRLHAGIRALQHGRRALILAIDNRATMVGRDFGFPTVPRHAFEQISNRIHSDPPLQLQLPLRCHRRMAGTYPRPRGQS